MKPVIAGVLALGTAAVTANKGGSVVSGTAMLLIAAFSPLALFKMVPLVEVSSVAHLHDLSRQPVRAADKAMRGALSFATNARAVTGGPSGGRQSGDLGVAGMLLGQTGGGQTGGGQTGGGHPGGGPEDHPLGPARPPSPASSRPPSPVPGNPVPGNPVPGNPVPGNPVPGNPVPGNPAPSKPALSKPAPSNPAPAKRASDGPAPVLLNAGH
jgi:hypothetical protein